MIIRTVLVALFALLTVHPQGALGEVYTWTNADGSISITDDAAKIPPQYREQAMKKSQDGDAGTVNYSKPADHNASPEAVEVSDEPEQAPKQETTDEEKKKAEAETRAVWEKMKKALRGY
jgi:hypothetical protein